MFRFRFQSDRSPQLILLLDAISSDRTDLSLDYFSQRQIEWAIQNGLGPLLFRTIQGGISDSSTAAWRSLKAADLTSRILMGTQLEAMGEIIEACRGRVPTLVLLKGMSIAEEFYPESHLRLMRDVDFLVPKKYVPAIEAILKEQGYRQSKTCYAAHHNMPFFHQGKNVWVEVHHGLFSGMQKTAMDKVFHCRNIFAELRSSTFQGREVFRLSNELQLVYLACHWGQTFQATGGAIAMLDTIYLLKRAGDAICWARILNWVDGCAAAAYLYLLLSYLDRYRLVNIAPDVMHQLFHSCSSFGRLSLRATHAIIDRYFIGGKPFGAVLSPRNLDIAWQILTLPKSILGQLILRKIMPRQSETG